MGQIPYMSLAYGSDPVDAVYAAASSSSKLSSADEKGRNLAAAERAASRFSVHGKAALGMLAPSKYQILLKLASQ